MMFFCILGMFLSCIKPPDYSNTPVLEFRSLSKTIMNQGVFGEDSVELVLFFTDGDGDFGSEAQSNVKNIFIKDNRTNETFREYKAPFIPTQGSTNGISGTISIRIYSTCCIFPEASGIFPCTQTDDFPFNDLTLDIYIKDRAGNQSNTVTTSVIKLNCS
ncbi:MAG: hypothetical protein IPO92_04105 [Saprospiraceae bacterium]|nr:hypothetical protein [Saprospiraceae bacterium]